MSFLHGLEGGAGESVEVAIAHGDSGCLVERLTVKIDFSDQRTGVNHLHSLCLSANMTHDRPDLPQFYKVNGICRFTLPKQAISCLNSQFLKIGHEWSHLLRIFKYRFKLER